MGVFRLCGESESCQDSVGDVGFCGIGHGETCSVFTEVNYSFHHLLGLICLSMAYVLHRALHR